MNYWLVRARWGGVDDKTTQFLQNDEWVNSYDDKYLETVKRVKEGDILLLADNSLINYYGICVSNEGDGRHLIVDSWKKFQEPIGFPAKGAYIKTIVKINDEELIQKTEEAKKLLEEMSSINILSIELENFTQFSSETLDFSLGLNIFIGENGTGKTQLLKIIYALIQSNNQLIEVLKEEKDPAFNFIIDKKIISILKPDNLTNLITKGKEKSKISLNLDKYTIDYSFFREGATLSGTQSVEKYKKKSLFIPAKEMLSFYTGFRSIYKQTSFDETFDDLAIHLGKLVPRNKPLNKFEKNILENLEKLLAGKIVLDNDRFYLEKEINRVIERTEITLVAEGLRKLGTIFHLISNGTIEKGSVIFWDEPEANLNPKFIKYIAEILWKLEKEGIQIFIATHSLFLVKELEILRKNSENIKYFSFGFDSKDNLRVSQDNYFDSLDDLIILDEEIYQNDRFMKDVK